MYYKILPESALFKKMWEVFERGKAADKAAKKWIKNQFGEFKSYAPKRNAVWGGIDAIQFESKPEGWKQVGKKYQQLYYPTVRLKKLINELEDLPAVQNKEIKDLLNYGNYSGAAGGGLVWNSMPGIIISKDYILIAASEVADDYKPVDGMTEILFSEYHQLRKVVEERKKAQVS